ncbi:MAG: type II toxin-antitoxin system VapC family toxin [Deltaproteobacteria bacterium]|nr:MAG: type II toxin-antitoxin system VapC family toxin [Deltaproteobacteria bacterium]
MKYIVDTHIWIAWLNGTLPNNSLDSLLRRGLVMLHPQVMGALRAGSFANRNETLRAFDALRSLLVPFSFTEAYEDIERFKMHEIKRVGFSDMAQCSSAQRLGLGIWTRDANMLKVAGRMRLPVLRLK